MAMIIPPTRWQNGTLPPESSSDKMAMHRGNQWTPEEDRRLVDLIDGDKILDIDCSAAQPKSALNPRTSAVFKARSRQKGIIRLTCSRQQIFDRHPNVRTGVDKHDVAGL
jgi:hypothetical protein